MFLEADLTGPNIACQNPASRIADAKGIGYIPVVPISFDYRLSDRPQRECEPMSRRTAELQRADLLRGIP